MRVVVTGANGMLGIDLCALLEKAGHQVVRTDVSVKEGMQVPAWESLDITDTPNPLSHYGGSKLAGEKLVAQLCRKHFICRSSWLFGIHGKSFPNTMLELSRTQTERFVVVDQVGSPTSTLDLSRTLISLLDS